jgi:tetratricopeptide (TPR) repeat protein
MRGREPIITIAGEGGIGKTALALEVAYTVLDEPTSPFECILWISLKTERLTAYGVREITNAVQDLTGAAEQLGAVVDSDFRGDVVALANLLEGIRTLLIIDNIETLDGSEVLAFYEALPDNVTYLLTSRIGLGQIERKFDLGPLDQHHAQILFRTFAHMRGVAHLTKLSEETVREVVTRLRYSPLAIRWYILAVEAGGRPNLTLADQSVLLDFCVRSVYESMRADAKELLTVLFALDRSATFDELAILTDTKIDNLRRAVHELLNGSMVILEPDHERELVSRIRLTEAARQFFRTVAVPDARVTEAILAKEEAYRRADRHRRADKYARELAPNTVRTRSEIDKPTAHLLRLALLASREETTERALEITERARQLNPDFWEVDRVEAFILSQSGQVVQATAMYRSALRKAQGDDEGRAIVSYYFAGHLARKAREVDQAIAFAREAHEYFGAPETEQQLGTFLLWNDQFEESQGYLISALERAYGKLRLITLTSLVDSWARWAEVVHAEDRKTLDAIHKAYTGFNVGAAEVKAGTYDFKLASATLECGSDCIYYVVSSETPAGNFIREIGSILNLLRKQQGSFREVS